MVPDLNAKQYCLMLFARHAAGVKWALFSAYGLYSEGLLPHAMALAKQVCARHFSQLKSLPAHGAMPLFRDPAELFHKISPA